MAKKKNPRLLRTTADDNDGGFPSNFQLRYERESGTGSIVNVTRAGGYVYARARYDVTDDMGAKQTKYIYGKTEDEVEKKMRAALRADASSKEIGATTTVATYMLGWLSQKKIDCRPATWRLYESNFRNHIAPHIGRVKFKALTAQNVRALLAKLTAAGIGDDTRKNVHKVLRGAYESALRDGSIARNPVATVRAPKVERVEQAVLSTEQATMLLDTARGTHYYPLIKLALISGMREAELWGLRPSDLHLADAKPHLFVDNQLAEDEGQLGLAPPKTASSRRRVDVDRDTAAMLFELADGLGADEYLFTTPDGFVMRRSNFLRRDWYPLLERAGLPKVKFHSLRHVANIALLAEGKASILDLAKRLGHASPRMTLERYSRVLPGAAADIAIITGSLFTR